MEYLCTTCCKRKRRDARLLPARERYLSSRIRFVLAESRRRDRPLVILSGEYGLLDPDDAIPWYDERLTPQSVDALAPTVARQLARKGATHVDFYARARATPGWAPYFRLLERACREQGIPLTHRRLPRTLV